MPNKKIPIAVAYGDGIGPEIMEATLRVIEASGASLEFFPVEIGEKVYLSGQSAGIEPSTWDTIRRSKAFLKAPITTPQGGGFKSLNVTVRTTLGLYANIRPCVSYFPFVNTKHPKMDVVIVRENEEDLYTGIEYRQSADAFHALKIITRTGCEKIIRYAFEYARSHQRKKVTCFTKDNILKLSDGLFHKIFDEIAAEYPDIQNEHWIVDIGAAKLADTPEEFDVIVLPNLYGDILSDVAAQIAGSVGLAGSANIGDHGAMFEAIHGSAPKRAGQNVANPSGLMLGAVMMLVYVGEIEAATKMHNGWLKTLEEGIHTYDIFKENVSKQKVGTKEFADAVINRLGQTPQNLKAVNYTKTLLKEVSTPKSSSPRKWNDKKELMGIDIFIDSLIPLEELQKKLIQLSNGKLKLTLIGNRGVRVWPEGKAETTCIDQWRCRFMSLKKGEAITSQQTIALLQQLTDANIDCIKTENLYNFNGKPSYTLGQDEQ